jgi:hypothetical protein
MCHGRSYLANLDSFVLAATPADKLPPGQHSPTPSLGTGVRPACIADAQGGSVS